MASPKILNQTNLKKTRLSKNAQAFLLELTDLYPSFLWRLGPRFKYKSPKAIFIDENSTLPYLNFCLNSLHELGHALSAHKDYKTDVERIRIESEAWERAKEEIEKHPNWQKNYQIIFDDNFAESQLDSYRDWLHQKSKCKKCGLTRFQTKDGAYHCPHCDYF